MLSISKLGSASDSAKYYTENAKDYYLKGNVELMAEFYGNATRDEEFSTDRFTQVLQGQLVNDDGEEVQLGRPDGAGNIEHVPGWDLTFSAPKSISMIALIEGDTRLIDAHNQAVKTALGYLENYATYTRKTVDGETSMVRTHDMFASLFTHTTSRELDPQLHTHAVIANATRDKDGKWLSIESKPLFKAKMTAGLMYRSELANIVKSLGYEIRLTNDHHKFFELKDVSDNETKIFSKRREQIEDAIRERGLTGARQIDLAAVMTRKSKQNVSPDELHDIWRQECDLAGFNLSGRVTPDQVPPHVMHDSKNNVLDDVRLTYRSLATQEATFTTHNIVKHAVQIGFGEFSPSHIENAIQTFVNRGELIPHENGFTTPNALNVETNIIKTALNMQGQYSPIFNHDKAEKWISDFNQSQEEKGEFKLTNGQSSSILNMLTTKDGVSNVNGWAGVGKTTMLNGFKEATAETDIVLRGIAPTGSATETLFKETGIAAQTTDSFLYLHEINQSKSAHNEVWLVDESSLMNAENTLKLFQTAETKGAKIVLLGDTKQLGSVEWGKIFSQLQAVGIQTSHMKDILRQKPNERYLSSVIAAANGNIPEALKQMRDSFVERENPVMSLVNEYEKMTVEDRKGSIFVVPDNATRGQFMSMVREVQQEEKLISKDEIESTILSNSNLDRVQLTDARFYEKNHIVEFQTDNEDLDIKRGEMFEVVADGARNSSILMRNIDDGREITWNPKELHDADNSKFSVTVFKQEDRKFAIGDSIKWTKSNKQLGLINGDIGKINALNVSSGIATIEFENGKVIERDLGQRNTMDWAYADTAFSAQGKTYERVFGILESFRENLVHQQSFYVALSRGKSTAKFFTDDFSNLERGLVGRTGEKTSALHNEDALTSVKNAAMKNKAGYLSGLEENAKRAIEHSSAVLSETKGIFSHTDLISHSLKHGFGKLTAKSLENEIEKQQKTKSLSVLSVGDKKFGERFYSTGDHLKKESALGVMAKQGLQSRHSMFSKSYADIFIKSRNERAERFGDVSALSKNEANAVREILSSKNESLILNSKDHESAHELMFGVVKMAMGVKGKEIRALTVRGSSKDIIQQQGIKASNALSFVDFIKDKMATGQNFSFKNEVWFVEDAALLGIDDTKNLMSVARATGARIVFNEDKDEQAIKGIKAMDVLRSQKIPSLNIVESHESNEISKANFEARTNAIDSAMSHIEDRIIEVDADNKKDADALRLTSVTRCYLDQNDKDRENTHVVITDNYTRKLFIESVRNDLKESGKIERNEQTVSSMKNAFLSPIEMSDARYYKEGMLVKFDKDREDIKGGVLYEVGKIDTKGNQLVLKAGDSEVTWHPSSATFADRYSQQVYHNKEMTISVNDKIRINESLFDKNNGGFHYKSGQLGHVKSIGENGVTVKLDNGKSFTFDRRTPMPADHGYATSHFSLKHSNSAGHVIALMDSKKPHSVKKEALINLLSNGKKGLTIVTDNKQKTAEELKKQSHKPTSALSAKSVQVQKNNERFNQSNGLIVTSKQRTIDKIEKNMKNAVEKVSKALQAARQQQATKQFQR